MLQILTPFQLVSTVDWLQRQTVLPDCRLQGDNTLATGCFVLNKILKFTHVPAGVLAK